MELSLQMGTGVCLQLSLEVTGWREAGQAGSVLNHVCVSMFLSWSHVILTEIPTGFLCLENRMMFVELLLNMLFSNWLLEKQASLGLKKH